MFWLSARGNSWSLFEFSRCAELEYFRFGGRGGQRRAWLSARRGVLAVMAWELQRGGLLDRREPRQRADIRSLTVPAKIALAISQKRFAAKEALFFF